MEIERLKEEGATYKSRAEKYDDARHEVEALNKTVRLMKEEIDRVKTSSSNPNQYWMPFSPVLRTMRW